MYKSAYVQEIPPAYLIWYWISFFFFFLISSKARPPYLNFFFKFITKNKTKKTKRPDLVYNVVGRVQK